MSAKTKRAGIIVLILLFALTFLFALSFFNGGKKVAQAYNTSIQRDILDDSIKDLFTDYTRTALNEKYDTMEELQAFQESLHPSGAVLSSFDRAEKIIRGEIVFEKGREFSTKPGAAKQIEQFGNVSSYSTNTLDLRYCTTDIMLTGLYALTGDTLNIFVEAEDSAHIPSLVLTQNHGQYVYYREKVQLYRGMNTFKFPDLSGNTQSGEMKGGAIYIANPYTRSEQGGDVSLYIEGGGSYPIFQKDGDENKFLSELKEYEKLRLEGRFKMPDMADLETDNAIFSIPSSTLYENYITNAEITPQKNLELWAEYFHKTFEFNGIPLTHDSVFGTYYDEKNTHLKVNLRYMTSLQNTGAYATDHHIGIYKQHPWLANFNYIKNHSVDYRFTFDIGHEIGHVLDTYPRKFDETTNNVNAANAYLGILGKQATSSLQPFDKALGHLASDYSLDRKAFDDGRVLYTENGNYDHNYLVWWDLESVFPGYWGKLNNYFRFDKTFTGTNAIERMVYYSSLIAGYDLTDYFDRWGVYLSKGATPFTKESASSYLNSGLDGAKQRGEISRDPAPHYWFVDAAEFSFMQKNAEGRPQSYRGEVPVITKITKSGDEYSLSIGGQPDSALLGYEVLSKTGEEPFRTAGFTYTSIFVDPHKYQTNPTYKVVAVNRYFQTKESAEKSDINSESSVASGVCLHNNKYYSDLKEAVSAAVDGDTIEILSDCYLQNADLYKELTFKLSNDAKKDVVISCPGGTYMMHVLKGIHLKGNENARLIIASGASASTYALIFAGSGVVEAENVTFRDCKSGMFAGAIYSQYAKIQLKNCKFENCSSSGVSGAIYTGGGEISIEDCTFSSPSCDLFFSAKPNLKLLKNIPEMTLGFSVLNEAAEVKTEDILLDGADLSRLHFTQSSYGATVKGGKLMIGEVSFHLTFKKDGKEDSLFLKSSTFTFGQEELNIIGADQYCTKYREGDTVYERGDSIVLTRDMSFEVETAEKATLTLRYKNDKLEVHRFVGEAGFYLPRYDGQERVVLWESSSGTYAAGEIFKSDRNETLSAVYLGYFSYEFFSKEGSQKFGYVEYGDEINVENNNEDGFIGWFAQGKIIERNQKVKITQKTVFTAIFEGEQFDLSSASIFVSDCIYDGKEQRPKVTVELDGQVLSEDFYTVEYQNNTEVGTATVIVKANGNYAKGQREATFQIQKATLLNVPADIIRVGASAKTLSDVKLPDGWRWENSNMTLSEGDNVAYATYEGRDKDNYSNVRKQITVIKNDVQQGGSQQGGSQQGGSQQGGSQQGGSQQGGSQQGGSQQGGTQQGGTQQGGTQQGGSQSGNEQDPGSGDQEQKPDEEQEQKPDGNEGENDPPEKIPEGELPEKTPEGERDPDRDLEEEEQKPEPDEDKKDEENRDEASSKEPEKEESSIGGGQSSGGVGGGSEGQGGLDGGEEKNNLLWLLLIPAIIIPAAGVVCFIVIKKKRNNG